MSSTAPLAVERLGLGREALAGQVAVVTGAGQGIGRQVARALAWLGASVVIAEIASSGAETERQIVSAGGSARFVRTDVSRQIDIEHLQRKAQDAYGAVSIVVNNAILCPVAPVLQMDVDLWDRTIAVNLRSAFLTCKTFLPGMVVRGQGTIVNMVSTDAMPGLSAYIASKQGLVGLTQSLAAEVGSKGVRVVALAPGFADTPGLRGVGRQLAPHLGMSEEEFLGLSLHPGYAGMMPADDAAAAVAYLIAALANEYHGEQVSGYQVLERAGLLAPADTGAPPSGAPAANPTPMLPEALALSERLQGIVADTEAEFGRLPVFVRPMARAGFKGKAGQSLQDWVTTAARLRQQLAAAQAGDGGALAALRADSPRLQELLGKLCGYCRGVPAEMARFTRDAELLRQTEETMAGRQALIRDLLAALGAVL